MSGSKDTSMPRPFTILIAALGGEGGGVLADWLVDAATHSDFPVQSTSIPGVSQRTGATTYYVEIFPVRQAELAGKRPVLALVPTPGAVDMVAASELLEAGRAMQKAFVTDQRTTLVASTHRIFATSEKMIPTDGRYGSEKILSASTKIAKQAILFDMLSQAQKAGTVINSVLFGAMAGSGVLPLSRAACEAAIRGAGKGAEASLRGFALGYEHAASAHALVPKAPEKLPPPPAKENQRVRNEFPGALHELLNQAVARLIDYQDVAYANLYLDRLRSVVDIDNATTGAGQDFPLTRETARLLVLWMTYEDIIRVAALKTRPERFAKLRKEAGALPGEPVMIVDFLKPGPEEFADILPPGLANWIKAWELKRRAQGRTLSFPLRLQSSSLKGFFALRFLARLKPLRRRSARFALEQAAIERWLAAINRHGLASRDLELVQEIIQCAALLRGYSGTQRRGRRAFEHIFDDLLEKETVEAQGITELKLALNAARSAALANPDAPPASPSPAGEPVVWLKAG
jgi:indolepyruvate ferredoxin oxidoreductase beta subunit